MSSGQLEIDGGRVALTLPALPKTSMIFAILAHILLFS